MESQTNVECEYSNTALLFIFHWPVTAVDNFPVDVYESTFLRDVTVKAGESTLITTANKNVPECRIQT